MAVYQYRGLNAQGNRSDGLVTADTAEQAREQLRSRSIFPTTLTETQKSESRTLRALWSRNRLSQSQLVSLTRQLAVLLRSGIPLAQSLETLAKQQERNFQEELLLDLSEQIQSGAGFAEALAQKSRHFSGIYINMVAAGEESGHLPVMLFRLAEYLQRFHQLRSKITAALTYPAFMAVVGLAVVTFLLAGVVPKITQVLLSQGAELPASTEALLTISGIFEQGWHILICLALGVFILYGRLLSNPTFRYRRDDLFLRVPVLREITEKAALSRFASTLASLLRSGIPAVEALKLTAGAVGNDVYARRLTQSAEAVTHGASLAVALRQESLPLSMIQMIDVGERSGELPEILEDLVADFDADLDVAIGRITTLLEPLIILAMAAMVGFIALAIIQPIMEISNVLH